MSDRWLSVEEIAEHLGVSKDTVYAWIRRREMPAHRIGYSAPMMNGLSRIGYMLSSEEHQANDLVDFAARAEEAGFDYAVISDHFHPWTNTQAQSPFVWSVLGAIAAKTDRLRVGTAVTCETESSMTSAMSRRG